MAAPSGRAAFKKKDGVLTLSADRLAVIWTPLPVGGPPVVSLAVKKIANLQQTPDSSPKVMLKIIEKTVEGIDPVAYLFHFNSLDARAEANAVKELLSRILTEIRSNDPSLPRPAGASPADGAPTATNGGGSGSAAMAFASAVNSKPVSATARWFDDTSLRNDIELQQSLMKKDRALHQTYMDALQTKPESISDSAFNSQFWSTRTNLLRAHAIETSQKKGAYNVLATVKPKTVDNVLKLNISVEQVQLIFAQHPLVKRIYNENVPRPLSEADFWSRFFLSKLSKKLRGERVTEIDNPDPLFDKYDESENSVGFQSKIMAQHVPHIIDVEANEENQGGFRSGNRKDQEMRPRANIPIVRTLNSLSAKIMANVAPADLGLEGGGPDGVDVDEDRLLRNELALRDLRGDAEEHRIALNVKEQSRFFSKHDSAPSSLAQVFASQVASEVLFDINVDLETLEGVEGGSGGLDLHKGMGIADDSDSDDDVAPERRRQHVGSRASRIAAEKEVMAAVLQRRSEKYGNADDDATPMGLQPHLADRSALTHATTIEFLHQFWSAFLSGDPDRAAELQYLNESLSRSLARIDAVADEAEREREEAIRKKKEEIRAYYKQTGKKVRWKPDSVRGGRRAVMTLMEPTIQSLKTAQAAYQRALAAEGMQATTEG